jgi:hypothetical protein
MASWMAIQGGSRAEILSRLGLADSEGETFPGSRRVPFSCRQFPDDWLVVFSEKFDWATDKRLIDLSALGFAVACQFEDKVEMAASLSAARGGAVLWKVFHDNTMSVFRLDVEGTPPAEFERQRDEAYKRQRDDGDESRCDYVQEVIHDLGKLVCGYRADEEVAAFRALRRSGSSPMPLGGARRPTLLEKLFRPLRQKPSPTE